MSTSKNPTPSSTTEAMQLSNNNYFIILSLVTLLVLGVGFFISKSLITNIRHSSKVLTQKNIANRQLDSDLTAAPLLIASYNTLSTQNMLVLKDALPTTSDFPGLISILEAAGNQNGILFTDISPALASGTLAPASTTSSTASPNYKSIDVTALFSGTYPSLLKFVTSLEQSARPVSITAISVTGSSSNMTGTLNLTTYYQDKAVLPFSMENI